MGDSFILYGSKFDKTLLTFDHSSKVCTNTDPRWGLKKWGPYDKNLIEKKQFKIAVLSSESHKDRVNQFWKWLKDGAGKFRGLDQVFKVKINPFGFKAARYSFDEYKKEITKIVQDDFDLCILTVEGFDPNVYNYAKNVLLGNGIPCQVLDVNKLNDIEENMQWYVENVALAIYAKMGGSPWVLSAEDAKPEIVLGVSRAMDPQRNVFIGFTTVFKQNGDFVLFNSKSPSTTWDDYENGLTELIKESIERYEQIEKKPENVVIHFHKTPGKKEQLAIENALHEKDIQYAMLHLNDFSKFRLFDTSTIKHIPQTGQYVNLSSSSALLMTDGLNNWGKRTGLGVPNVLEVVMDKKSTISLNEFPRLLKQVYDFGQINWRGFNAKAIPVTLTYSYLIARMASRLAQGGTWNDIIVNNKLCKKAWFL